MILPFDMIIPLTEMNNCPTSMVKSYQRNVLDMYFGELNLFVLLIGSPASMFMADDFIQLD